MESKTIKTTAGKMYSAVCSSDCDICTESGILIKSLKANQQDYFIAPDAKIIAEQSDIIITECFNDAPIESSVDRGVKATTQYTIKQQ